MWFASFILDVTFFFVALTFGIGFICMGIKLTVSFMNHIVDWFEKALGGVSKKFSGNRSFYDKFNKYGRY